MKGELAVFWGVNFPGYLDSTLGGSILKSCA